MRHPPLLLSLILLERKYFDFDIRLFFGNGGFLPGSALAFSECGAMWAYHIVIIGLYSIEPLSEGIDILHAESVQIGNIFLSMRHIALGDTIANWILIAKLPLGWSYFAALIDAWKFILLSLGFAGTASAFELDWNVLISLDSFFVRCVSRRHWYSVIVIYI